MVDGILFELPAQKEILDAWGTRNGDGKIFDEEGKLKIEPCREKDQPEENHDDRFAIPPEKRSRSARTFIRNDHFRSGSEQCPTMDSNI